MKCVLHISCKNGCYWLFTEDFLHSFEGKSVIKVKSFFILLYFSFGLFVPSACCVKGVIHICATLQEMNKCLCSVAVEVILRDPKDDLCPCCFKGRQQTRPSKDIWMKSLLFFFFALKKKLGLMRVSTLHPIMLSVVFNFYHVTF